MGLFKPGWMKNDRESALRAVRLINDPEELRAILRTETPAQDQGIRALVVIEASAKLGDERKLYEIAADTSHSEEWRGYGIRRRAVDALRDQALLARLLREKPSLDDFDYRRDSSELYILEKLTDAEILIAILKDSTFCAAHPKVADQIVMKLGEAALYQYACETPHFKDALTAFYAAEKRKLSFYDGDFSHALRLMLTKGAEFCDELFAPHDIGYYLKLRRDAASVEERRQAALALEKMMAQTECLARIFRKHIMEYAQAPVHGMKNENYNGIHDEYGVHGGHTKAFVLGGLGMTFPPCLSGDKE